MTKNAQTVVVALMLSGSAINLIGALAMTVWRKPGATIGGSYAAAHPETYVKQNRIKTVRIIHLIGISLFLAGVLTILVFLVLGLLTKA